MKLHTGLQSGAACYTVQSSDDSLSKIAQKFYGAASLSNMQKIYYSNEAAIGPNSSILRPGLQLFIPD